MLVLRPLQEQPSGSPSLSRYMAHMVDTVVSTIITNEVVWSPIIRDPSPLNRKCTNIIRSIINYLIFYIYNRKIDLNISDFKIKGTWKVKKNFLKFVKLNELKNNNFYKRNRTWCFKNAGWKQTIIKILATILHVFDLQSSSRKICCTSYSICYALLHFQIYSFK